MKMNSSSPPVPFLQRQVKSQAAVEFALAFPIFLMIIFGIIDFSLLFTAWLSIQNMARQAVRYAATGQYDSAQYCAAADLAINGGDANGTCFDGPNKNQEIDYARLKSVHDVAQQFSYFIFDESSLIVPATDYVKKGYLSVTICSTRDVVAPPNIQDFVYNFPQSGGMELGTYGRCYLKSDDTKTQEDVGAPGDSVIVGVDFNHPYLTPFINSVWPMFHLASTRQAIVERFRIAKVRGLPLPFLMPTMTPLPATITLTPTTTSTPLPTLTMTTTATNTATPTPTSTPGPCSNDSYFLREWWDGISGNAVTDLTGNVKYPYNPTGVNTAYTGGGVGLETIHGSSGMDNHGERLRGTICVDQTTTYRFFLASDDGGEFWLADNSGSMNLVASENSWAAYQAWQFGSERSGQITLIGRRPYRFEVLSKNGGGGYDASIGWTSGANLDTNIAGNVKVIPLAYLSGVQPDATLTPTATPTAICPGVNGTGLRGDYYDWTDFSQPARGWWTSTALPLVASRIDPVINFPNSSPGWQAPAPSTKFAVHWSGKVLAPATGQYTFYSNSDDGQYLVISVVDTVGNKRDYVLVNDWNGHGMTEKSGQISLTACQQYDISLEYYQGSGGYGEILSWTVPNGSKEVIPQAFLFPGDPALTSTPGPTKTATLTPTITKTPTITITPTRTLTPTVTWTPNCNLSGGITTTNSTSTIQNGMAYGCPSGCSDAPFLKDAMGNSLVPGTYSWTVEEVNPPKWIVNSGSFFLGAGQVLDPVLGVRVPIGNFTNPPPASYYPGIFKVTIWQSNTPGCGQKTDNFTILAAVPSPTPTVTSTPTSTPTATVPTPTPTRTRTPTATQATPTQTMTPKPTSTPTRTPFGCTDC